MPNHYTTIAICSPGYDFDCEAFNSEQNNNSCLCSAVKPMPEELKGTTATSNEQNWYNWALENWGTKWGTYRSKAFALDGDGSPVIIKFQSAWSPPKILKEIGEYLKEKYGFDNVVFVGFEPYSNTVDFSLNSQE